MSETIETPPIVFRRMELSDIEAMAEWLFPRLQVCFPAASPATIRSFLIGAGSSAGQWCGRTDRAAAAAYVQPGILGTPDEVRIVFALCVDPEADQEEIGALHFEIVRWARRMGVGGVQLSEFTDGDRSYIRDRIGRLDRGQTFTWRQAMAE